MKEDDRRAVALVDVRQPQAVDLAIAGLEVEIGQPGEPLVRCADDVHRASPQGLTLQDAPRQSSSLASLRASRASISA